MFYMRPARYFPGQTTTKMIIDNLCYVMNTMLENNQFAQKEGIGFIACMDNWKMKNFEVNYCYQFMMTLQGFMVPVKTQLFLIVNPPSWFGTIWKIMKPMLAPSFRKRVKICPEFKIAKYLQPGFEQFLPDDMASGQAYTDNMVMDFIAYREHVETGLPHCSDPDGSVHESSNRGNDDMESVGGQSLSHDSDADRHSLHSFSGGHFSAASSDQGDDDDASINCDINDEAALEETTTRRASIS
jgi:CRAL/TRIO domain